jgi:hypothetical protein
MNNLRIVSDNAVDRATLTASSTAGALAVTNLQIDTKSDVWRATGIAASIYAAWPSLETIQAIAFPFCNWSPTVTKRVRLTSEPSVTNMLTTSETPSASPWSRTNCIASPFFATAPDGSYSAQFIREDVTVSAAHELRTSTITLNAGTPYAMSVFAKQGSRRYVRVGFSSVFSYSNFSAYVIFDLQTGTISSTAGAGVTGSITAQGNGWYRCNVFFFVSKTATGTNYIGLQSDAVTTTYTGDGVSGLYVWGAQVEQIPTTLGGELITNTTFDAFLAGWQATQQGSSTVTWSSTNGGSASINGDGTNTAFLSQAIPTTPGVTYLFVFTLTNTGVLAKVGNTQNIGDIINSPTLLGGATYALTFTATNATTWVSFGRSSAGAVYIDNVSVKRLTYTNAVTSYYPSQDTFISRASTGTYIASDGTMKSAAINVARLTYNPNNLSAPPKLLLEQVATNVLTASGTLTTGWSGCNIAAATGTMYRAFETYQIVSKATTSANESRTQSFGTIAIGTRYTATIALRAGSVSSCAIGLYDSAGVSWGANADSFCVILEGPGTAVQTSGGLFVISNLSLTVDTVIQITRNYVSGGTGSFVIYPNNTTSVTVGDSILATRVQVEGQGFASSYFPTTTAAATRAADIWSSPLGTRPLGYIDTWQSYTYDSGAVLACPAPAVTLRGWTAAQAASAYAYGGGAYARMWLPAAVQAYGMTVDITDANNLQGYVEAARLVAGPYWSPTYNASAAELDPVDTTELYRTDAGDQGANAGYIYRRVPITLETMPATDRAALVNILRNSRAYPILLSLFPGSADLTLERDNMVYGRRPKDSNVAIQYATTYSTTVEIEEI